MEEFNAPSKPITKGAVGGTSQKDRRFTDTFFDTHRFPGRFPTGRPFWGEREFAANADQGHDAGFVTADLQCGEYVADDLGNVDRGACLRSAWHAPWLPLAKYWKYNYKRKLITFEYQKMRSDERRATVDFYRAASKLGIQLNLRVDEGIRPHPQIVNELGEPPELWKVAEAAIANDPWLLGWIDEPNPALATVLNIHASGLPFMTSYVPPERQQEAVQAVIAAPPNVDLLEMIASMQATILALTEKEAKREHSEKTRAGIARAKEAVA